MVFNLKPLDWESSALTTKTLLHKEDLILKLSQQIKYCISKIFMEKIYRKYAPETSSRALFNFGTQLHYNVNKFKKQFWK